MIYLDSASTTKPRKEVIDAVMPYMTEMWFNPSSMYGKAVEVKDAIEEARGNVACFIGANPEEIYFTSGASESNNWAIRGFIDKYNIQNIKPHIITTRLEHKSIINAIHNRALNAEIHYVNNDENGLIDYRHLKQLLWYCEGKPILVSICMANNEIGTVQDIVSISKAVHKVGGVLHVDATQALPHIPIYVKAFGIDMLSGSGHKLGAFKGSGFLYKKNETEIEPLIYGTQERGSRGGTENVIGIIGLGEAVKHVEFDSRNTRLGNYDRMLNVKFYAIEKLESKFGCKINGSEEYGLSNNINVTFPQNITGESLLYTLDMSDICISTGSACNSKSIEPSHVLKAIGLSDEEAARTIRITLSKDTTYEDIDKFIYELESAIKLIESENDHDID